MNREFYTFFNMALTYVGEEKSIFSYLCFLILSMFLGDEYQWKGPFYFIQGADPQFGLIKAWAVGNTGSGDDEWGEEIKLTEQAVQAINKLNPKPKFFVLCGDLIHGMPGKAIKGVEWDHKSIFFILQIGNKAWT